MSGKTIKDKLLTRDYCLILAANFLLYFGFYLLMPVLPLYLSEQFGAGNDTIGLVLACYTVAALLVRPFSGYLLDTFARKPLYLMAFFIFTAIFSGYLLAGTLTMFAVLRVAHGFAFGTVTVSGNTIVIDVMPSSRRGEGLGYYGLVNNMSMAVGPMTGLFLHDYFSYDVIFLAALTSCAIGFVVATFVNTPFKPPIVRTPVSLDRFILLKGLPAGVALMMFSVPYGMTSSYVAMYAREVGITAGTGLFFTLMAVGTAVSRIRSGRQVDKGKIIRVILSGMVLVSVSYFIYSFSYRIVHIDKTIGTVVFFGVALLLGVGFGTMFPAFNTLFVNLAPNNQRGTATSTYLTSWDVGIGFGLTAGGAIAQRYTFADAYFFGACLTGVSLLYFAFVAAPHFHRNRLR